MPETEGGGEHEIAEERSRTRSLLTSAPALIGGVAALITAITGLIVGLNQVGIIGGGDGGSPAGTTPTDAAETTPAGAAAVFAPRTTPGGRVYFEGETMYVTATTPNRPLVVTADLEEPLRDVAMTVRARRISGAQSFGAGLICRYDNAKNYYLLAVLSGGHYNIVKYRAGKLIPLRRGSYEAGGDESSVEVVCVGDDPTSLTLRVDGEEVTTVRDPDGIESGVVGIRVGTDESRVTVGFDDFVLRSL